MARVAPLILPGQLAPLPKGYGKRLPLFDETSKISARQKLVKVIDFNDLEEIDSDDAKMRIITQSFSRDVKTWFCSLNSNSIVNLKQLTNVFIARWEVKNKPLQIIFEYENLKSNPNEPV